MSRYAKKQQPYKSDQQCMYVMTKAGCKKGDQCNFMHPTPMTMMQQVVQEEAKPAKKAGNNRKVTQLEDVVESEMMMTQQDFSNYKGRKVSVMNEEMEEVKESVRQKENT
jgi:hypothetical protein